MALSIEEERGTGAAMIVAFCAVSFSGFVMGMLVGWLIWGL